VSDIASAAAEHVPPDAAERRRGRLMIAALVAIFLAVLAWQLVTRVFHAPLRGDVTVSSVQAVQDGAGWWQMTAVWKAPTDSGGCVVLPWRSARSERGFEVQSQLMAPTDQAFPSICMQPTASAVLQTTKANPTGQSVVVNGTTFVVVQGTSDGTPQVTP
jgi:hypothetical protein